MDGAFHFLCHQPGSISSFLLCINCPKSCNIGRKSLLGLRQTCNFANFLYEALLPEHLAAVDHEKRAQLQGI